MQTKPLLSQLSTYKESTLILPEEESKYQDLVHFLNNATHCFSRETSDHITGSAWVVNHDYTKVLLTHHKKLGLWIQLGGHADNDPNVQAVAYREAQEESGIENLSLAQEGIYDIDIHHIHGACKTHYDIRYLFKAPKGAQYKVSEESNDLAWVSLKEITDYTTSRTVLRMADKLDLCNKL